jgi:heat shock protein HtpX
MIAQGRPRWYKPDVALSMRMVFTMFVLGALYVVFGAVLVYYHLYLLLPILIIVAGIQLFFSDKITLMAMGARVLDDHEMPKLQDIVARLAMQANLPKPKVAFIDTSVPNAFATGHNKNDAVVVVTRGILDRLDDAELEGVLAHELTHIINRDMLVMTIATFFSMVISLLMQSLLWSSLFGGGYGGYGRRRNDNSGEGNVLAIVLLVSLAVYALSFLLIRALSRYRELAADRGAALITGAPQNLASALLRISDPRQSARIPTQDIRRSEAVAVLGIVPSLNSNSLAGLLSTHPSTEDRVERLRQMQAQMESARYLG